MASSLPEEEFGKFRVVFRGNTWTVHAWAKIAAQVTFKVDPTQKPKSIDLISTLIMTRAG